MTSMMDQQTAMFSQLNAIVDAMKLNVEKPETPIRSPPHKRRVTEVKVADRTNRATDGVKEESDKTNENEKKARKGNDQPRAKKRQNSEAEQTEEKSKSKAIRSNYYEGLYIEDDEMGEEDDDESYKTEQGSSSDDDKSSQEDYEEEDHHWHEVENGTHLEFVDSPITEQDQNEIRRDLFGENYHEPLNTTESNKNETNNYNTEDHETPTKENKKEGEAQKGPGETR